MNQWLAKQVLDIGAYGVVWPRVSTVEQAYNAVASCRYPRPNGCAGVRAGGHARRSARARRALLGCHAAGVLHEGRRVAARPRTARFSSSSCARTSSAIDNLPRILNEVPGIGVVLIGEGDLSQNLGYPASIRSSGRRRGDDRDPPHLRRARGRLRPSARRRPERAARDRRRLQVPDGGAGAHASRVSTRAGRLPEGR